MTYDDRESVEEVIKKISEEILTDIDNLLEEAKDKDYSKEEAPDYVTDHIMKRLMGDPYLREQIRTAKGWELIANMIKREVKERIAVRRKKYYSKKYMDIYRSDRPLAWKRAEIKKLKKVFFEEEDIKELREKELEKRKEEREFFKSIEKENELMGKWEKEDEAWEREMGKREVIEAERPWKKYPARFAKLPLSEREEIREKWYKEQRKKYKEKYGFWDRTKLWGKGKDKVRIERAKLRADRGIAYGDAKVKDADAYVKKYREYQKLKASGASKEGLKEARKELKVLKKEARGSRWKRAARGANRFASAPGKFAKSASGLVMKGFMLAVFVGIGAVAMAVVGHWSFFLAFLAWGLFYLLPDPNDIKIPDHIKEIGEDNPLVWSMIFSWKKDKNPYLRNARTGWGTLRSITKICVFGFFIYGVYTSPVPLGNIALIILSFFGYYSLKISYDIDKPYELIESLMRFAGLGFFFIPWIIMYGIFNSMLLAFIAMAFFAIPPIPKDRKSSQLMAMYDFYDKLIFGIIMIGVLIGFLAGWEVSAALSATFIYFWFVTGIAGFFSPAEARPAMGFLMLGAATVIYGIGPGTQDVMSALFGPWWPTIQNTFSSITEPIAEAFGGFANTLRSGWLLLTDPVGYATQLINGTHAANPIGKTGALGVEITDVSISPIFPEQPFVITAMIKNEGSFDADNVTMFLSTGYEAPTKGLPKPAPEEGRVLLLIPKFRKEALTFGEMFGYGGDELVKCWEDRTPTDNRSCDNKLTKQNIWQPVFTSESGVSCDVINEYELREKYIPIKVSVTYNYSSDSQVDVEFISQNEWQRLAESNQLSQKLRFIQSRYSTAPVEFPIGTPGLKNPILATQKFHIGMRIEAGGIKGGIDNIDKITLYYPKDFEMDGDCTPGKGHKESPDSEFNTITWYRLAGGPRVFYCPFKALGDDKLGGPTKTYVVKAHAEYTFTKWREKDTRIEFGGKCCSENDCLEDQICSAEGMCIPKGAATSQELCPGKCHEPSQQEKDDAVKAAAGINGVAEELIKAVMDQESRTYGHCKDESTVNMGADGELGMMQVMPTTAESVGFDNICGYENNIKAGTKYLAQQINKFSQHKDKIRFALAAYNWGPSRVQRAIDYCGDTWNEIISSDCSDRGYNPPSSTQTYVSSVCGYSGVNCEINTTNT